MAFSWAARDTKSSSSIGSTARIVSTNSTIGSTNSPIVSTNSPTGSTDSSPISTALQELSVEAQDFYVPSSIRVLEEAPSPLEFLRSYVMPNIPVVVRGGVRQWPAITKWTDDYLCQCLGKFSVHFFSIVRMSENWNQ